MLKRIVAQGLALTGVNALARRHHRGGVTVLMYHGVMEDGFDSAEGDWLQVRASEFRSQMQHLGQYYRVVPLERAWEGDDDGRPRVALTFDDGYANNFRVAFPILREFGFSATVFLVTGAIGTRRPFWFDRLQMALRGRVAPPELKRIKENLKAGTHPHDIDDAVDTLLRGHPDAGAISEDAVEAYRPLNREEIAEMAASGLVRFGSHTHRHEILPRLNQAEAERTLLQSQEILNTLPGNGGYFCFPNGGWTPEHITLCRRLGFEGAVLTRPGVWKNRADPFTIPRFGIGRGADAATFAATVSGVLPKIQQALGR
ncbi:polysaccharide deacetylase family protein [Methylococcus geothermalis]|uniref:Polysaccharide deacetylase family protein n=1 Tax=Methylococcus geothermalis TaxID=2681310 RepID=A0A858Q4A9_9GAMM|nr:polysaccharide deacetylase family protein [Methylococcus geothermalis]QJD28654.1 polysaccharide deacetylase family protein [Methylococcus geothermalis]